MRRFAWRRLVAPLLVGAAMMGCSSHRSSELATTMREAFTSAGAVPITLDFDATLVADTADPSTLDRLVAAQLLFTVGQLNGDASVGRLDRASVGPRTVTPVGARYEIGYHARLPVAWGGGAVPSSYTFTLPRDVTQAAQTSFAQKYGGACTDPEGGTVDAGDVFLFYRPRQSGCALEAADVTNAVATVSADAVPERETYPEYQRIWDDGELDVVAVFGREADPPAAGDEGVRAYDDFVARATDYVRGLDASSKATNDSSTSDPNVTLAATLADGRRVRVDIVSVGPSVRADASFAPWYDARTPNADAIVYSGHAGLGDNVRALMGMGVFQPKKYVLAAWNGCDTFAYVDDTLVARRAQLNPDDPKGTLYMDTLTNVLGGYFHSEASTSMLLLDALVGSAEGTPKKYREIFSDVDPSQIMLVSGDEDNVFAPGMIPAAPGAASTPPPSGAPSSATPPATTTPAAPRPRAHACSVGAPATEDSTGAILFAALGSLLLSRLRRRRAR